MENIYLSSDHSLYQQNEIQVSNVNWSYNETHIQTFQTSSVKCEGPIFCISTMANLFYIFLQLRLSLRVLVYLLLHIQFPSTARILPERLYPMAEKTEDNTSYVGAKSHISKFIKYNINIILCKNYSFQLQ